MTIWQAIILGIVQGLGEFLPISSSAHLILVPWLFGWTDDGGLAFDVALHWGTLVAVLIVFWRDWIRLIGAGLASLKDRKFAADADRRIFWALVVSSIPGAIFGMLLNKWAERELRSPLLIAGTMAVMGVLLWVADRAGRKNRSIEQMENKSAATVGLAQALALIPGVSRSGSTITTGLLLGFDRESIARFSFLMSTPIIFGAGVVKLPKLLKAINHGEVQLTGAAVLAGMVAAAIVGVIVIKWMLKYLRTNSYLPFALYRLAVAIGVVALIALHVRPASAPEETAPAEASHSAAP